MIVLQVQAMCRRCVGDRSTLTSVEEDNSLKRVKEIRRNS
jgi:hypothetical protein